MLKIAPDLSLPREAVTQTFAILAKRGAGKTYTAAVMVEEMLKADLTAVVVDPIGVWWGLRAGADGKSEGLPIIVLGDDHGDVPLEASAGTVIADLAVDERLSLVLDLSLFRKNEQGRFMQDFAERLYHRNREALHLVLDEADAFAPQRPMPGEQRLLGAVEDLVRRGRARGIGVTLVTQRAAVLNKNVLTQVEVLITLRTIAPQDRDAVDEWVKVHGTPEQRTELMASLPSLPIGVAWIWSPGWLDLFKQVHIRHRKTFDSSATPKVGETKTKPKTLAPVDIEKLKARMSETIERVRADDPRELRRRIVELERQVKKTPAGPAQPPVERVEVPVFKDGQLKRLESITSRFQKTSEAMLAGIGKVVTILDQVRSKQTQAPSSPKAQAVPDGYAIANRPAHNSTNRAAESGLRRMMVALAQRPQGLTAKQLGVRAGLSSSSGTFGTYLAKGRSEGWIEGSRDLLRITEGGIKALGSYSPLPEGRNLLNYWLDELGSGSGAARMLEVLANSGKAMAADELAERSSLSAASGTFGTYLSRLRTLELVTGSRAALRASEDLF